MPRKAFFLAFVLVLLPLLGCNVPASAADNGNNAVTPVSGGTLRIISSAAPDVLGYLPDMDTTDFEAVLPAVERLLDVSADRSSGNGLEPVLADNYEEDLIGKRITFHIRHGVKFHDGTDLNAQAVAWNFQSFAEASRLPYQSYYDRNDIIDDYTLAVYFKEYSNQLIQSWGRLPIVSPTAFQVNGKEWSRTHVVGTGPFKLKTFVRDDHIIWEAFNNYWQSGKPYLDSICVYHVPESVTCEAMIKRADADEWDNVPIDSIDQLIEEGFTKVSGWGGYPFAICLDTVLPDDPFSRLEVRQALEYALDKPLLKSNLGLSSLEPMTMIAPPGEWGYDPAYPARNYNLDKAEQLLVEAGYPNGFHTTMLILNDYVNREIGELVQAQLVQVGVNVNLDAADPGRYYGILRGGTSYSGMVLLNYSLEPNFLTTYMDCFSTDAVNEISFLSHTPALQTLDAEARTITDAAGQQAITKDIVRYIADNALVIPLFNNPAAAIVQPYVHTTRYSQGTQRWQSEDTSISNTESIRLELSGIPSSITAGNLHTLTVTAKNTAGEIFSSYSGTVNLISDDPQIVIEPASHTFNPAVDKGSYNYSITFKTAGIRSVSAIDSFSSLVTSTGITVNAGEASNFLVYGISSPTLRGRAENVTVKTLDHFGNTVTNYRGTISFSSTDNIVEKPSNYTFVAADEGIHTFTKGIVFHTAGVQSIVACDLSDQNISGGQSGIEVKTDKIIAPDIKTLTAFYMENNGNIALNGRLNSMGTAGQVQVSFEYWPLSIGQGASGSSDSSSQIVYATNPITINTLPGGYTEFAISISGIDPSRIYAFRAKAVGDGVALGNQATFSVEPIVTTEINTKTTTSTATLYGYFSPGMENTGEYYVCFEFGETTSYGYITNGESMTGNASLVQKVKGLKAGQQYHYRMRATGNNHTFYYGNDHTFNTYPAPAMTPVVTTEPASNVSANRVTLNGYLADLGTSSHVTVSTEIWADGSSTGADLSFQDEGGAGGGGGGGGKPPMSAPGAISDTISGLSPGTLYHYRTKAEGDGVSYGIELTFTTLSEAVPPTITVDVPPDITANPVTVSGTLVDMGTAKVVDIYLNYSFNGTTGSGGGRILAMTQPGPFSTNISIHSGTVYNYTFSARGDGTATSPVQTFSTEEYTPITPRIVTGTARNITGTMATVSYELTDKDIFDDIELSFEYGTTLDYGNTAIASPYPAFGTVAGTVRLTGLAPNHLYHYRAKAKGFSIGYGDDKTFSTGVSGVTGGFAISGFPSTIKAGASGNLFIEARDESGNINVGYNGTVHFTSSDPEAILPGDYTFVSNDNGTHQFTITLKTIGMQSITVSDTENSSLTGTQGNIKVKSSSSGSSGGGGGGGGNPPAPAIRVSGLTAVTPISLNTDGTTKAAAQYRSNDGKLTLDIAAGTKLTNSTGVVLTTLSTAVLANPPAPPDGNAILLAYEFGPEGAAFNPALTLTFSYGTLPEGAKNISLAYWNGAAWETVQSTVDTAKGTITAQISHFSKYALIYQVPSPANIAFIGITISPQNVKPDEKVTIQATVTNSGDLSGSYKLTLKVNERQVEVKEITVDGGKTETVSFEVQRGMEGEYPLDVNGQKGQFTVGTAAPTPSGTIAEVASPTPTPAQTTIPAFTDKASPTSPAAAVPANPSTSPTGTSSDAQNEEKPAAPVLWIVIGIVAVIAVLIGTMIVLNKRRQQNI